MKDLQKLHDELENMRFDLHDNERASLKNKVEALGEFAQNGLKEAISTIDSALDRIQELEDELEEAQEKIAELEREEHATV